MVVIVSIVITITNLTDGSFFRSDKKQFIICDTDLGQDPGDMYAISRLLLEENLELKGITTVHRMLYRSARDHSAKKSYEIALKLIGSLKKESVKVISGAETMFHPEENIHSPQPAADFIIDLCNNTSPKRKVIVFCMGPLTNIANAIKKEPSISSKLILYFSGTIYESKTRIWNKNEFNVKNDLDAFDFIINETEAELRIIPFNLSSKLHFNDDEYSELINENVTFATLLDELYHSFEMKEKQTAEELALVEVYLHEKFGGYKNVTSPPENIQKSIKVYYTLNYELMKADFLSVHKRDEYD